MLPKNHYLNTGSDKVTGTYNSIYCGTVESFGFVPFAEVCKMGETLYRKTLRQRDDYDEVKDLKEEIKVVQEFLKKRRSAKNGR